MKTVKSFPKRVNFSPFLSDIFSKGTVFCQKGVGRGFGEKNMEVCQMKIESGMVNRPVYNEMPVSHTEVKTKTETPDAVHTNGNMQMSVVSSAEKDTMTETQIQEQAGNEDVASRRIKSAVDHANQTMRHAKTKCEFSYHEETKRVSIKVIDEETEEVIREIPPEETLEMLSRIWELAGLMVDEKR